MKIVNREFHRNYEEIEKLEAGIVLSGYEVKSIRNNAIKLDDSYVKIMDGEAYLVNADIPLYQFARSKDYDPRHRRKLLLHKKELIRLITKM